MSGTENAPQQPAVATKKPNYPDDTVTLKVGGAAFAGWQDVRIVRGMEMFPSHFVLVLTEKLPGQPKALAIDPGQTFQLLIGTDLVMTGYIDLYRARVSAKQHQIVVAGRSATEDLVDCAAGVTSGQERQARMTFSASSLLQLARDLCAPFGLTVSEPDGEGTAIVSLGDGIPQFTIQLGQSVYDILEPIARWKQMTLLDGTDGNLVLAKVGTTKAASGFTLPGSVEDAEVSFDKQGRFTVYLPAQFSVDTSFDAASAQGAASSNYFAPVPDDAAFKGQPGISGAPRYRPRFVVSEQITFDLNLAEYRAKWQKARDFGRSQQLTATVARWRDSAGTLWAPNVLAPVDIPILKLPNLTWLIAQVVYMKGFGGGGREGGGTRSVVTLMPPEAFQPEPTFYSPFDPQVAAAQRDALQQRASAAQANAEGSRSISNPGAGAGGNVHAGESPGGV